MLNASEFGICNQAINTLQTQGEATCIVPQVIYEFWTVATRPLTANGFGWDAARTDQEIQNMFSNFDFYPDDPRVFTTWMGLVVNHQVMGKPAHDARLAAACLVHQVDFLLTLNPSDFKRFTVQVVEPDRV